VGRGVSVEGLICGGTLVIARLLTNTELERVADMLSGIAADIRKGEDQRGAKIELWVRDDLTG
jgi:hypothetical protein